MAKSDVENFIITSSENSTYIRVREYELHKYFDSISNYQNLTLEIDTDSIYILGTFNRISRLKNLDKVILHFERSGIYSPN